MDTINAISLFDEVTIQADVLIPVLEALRRELDADQAMAIIAGAMRSRYERRYASLAATIGGDSVNKWNEMNAAMMKKSGGVVVIEGARKEKNAVFFTATRCKYAEYFTGIQEKELGKILCCEIDYHITKAAGPGITLERNKTIMDGDDCCSFHYTMPANMI